TGLPCAAYIPTSCLQVDALLHYTNNFPASPPLPYGRGLLGGEVNKLCRFFLSNLLKKRTRSTPIHYGVKIW
ncbi:hypothetical protein, partial [Candidatus Hakubella thermalkaliphila]|uniref:hypothetical protein n=1 Tax=Candidatus Hakubella thermalkaliphila TaxID=2754717 RepID=UPI001C6143E9